MGGLGDRAPAAGVTLAGEGDDLLQGERGAVGGAERGENCTAGEHRHAAAISAAADRAGGVDHGVCDLAGDSLRSPERAPVDDQAHADTGRELEVDDVLAPASGAPLDSLRAPRLASLSTRTGSLSAAVMA